jgi:hypothetical protein
LKLGFFLLALACLLGFLIVVDQNRSCLASIKGLDGLALCGIGFFLNNFVIILRNLEANRLFIILIYGIIWATSNW